MIRADPFAHREQLPEPGRAWLVRRVVVTGPECTGKTTIAGALAAEWRAPLVPEAARVYAEEAVLAGRQLSATDVEPIARLAMSVDDAVMQMDLMNNDFLVFTNAASREMNVLYRRKDGHYGLIEAQAAKAAVAVPRAG